MSEQNSCCQEWRDDCNKHLSRIATLEQQVAALIEERNQEHSMACEIHAANLEIRYELAAAQAQLEEARAEIERLKREN